jgi:hypothetical protein
MAATQGTKLIAGIVPADDTDTYPTHDAKWGKGGIVHVQSESDLANLSDERLTEGQLATVADRDGLLYQLDDKAAGTWSILSLGSGLKVVDNNSARDAIPTDEREEGMIVIVLDPDDNNTNEYKEYQLQGGTTDSDWQEVLLLTPSELDTQIANNSFVQDNTSARHTHSNKSLLDNISDEGSGAIITSSERGNLHTHSNKSVLDAITNGGSGKIITASERSNLHTHSNKSTLDSISSAGSGQVITTQERTDLEDNADARHTHPNKSTLDALSSAGSGDVITNDERNLITPQRVQKDSDFTVSAGDYSVLYFCDTTINGQSITVTFPDDVNNFENMWHVYVLALGSYEVVLEAASGASLRSPGSLNKLVEEFAMASAFHFDQSGSSVWYLEGRIA